MRKHRSRQRQNRPLQVLLHPVPAVAAFRHDRKRWRLRQQRCLEVASQPAMLSWSMRRVGLIDITVGNAARLGASQRSSTRRCASHHIATQGASRWGHPGGSRAFSGDGPPQAPVAPGRSCEAKYKRAHEFAASRRAVIERRSTYGQSVDQKKVGTGPPSGRRLRGCRPPSIVPRA
jgi:hypothetical protein